MKNPGSFLVCSALDGLLLTLNVTSALLFFLTQILFMEKAELDLSRMSRTLQEWVESSSQGEILSRSNVHEILLRFRRLYLTIQIFNRAFAQSIFLWKFICLVVSIFGWFFGVRFIRTEAVLGFLRSSSRSMLRRITRCSMKKRLPSPRILGRSKTSFWL